MFAVLIITDINLNNNGLIKHNANIHANKAILTLERAKMLLMCVCNIKTKYLYVQRKKGSWNDMMKI